MPSIALYCLVWNAGHVGLSFPGPTRVGWRHKKDQCIYDHIWTFYIHQDDSHGVQECTSVGRKFAPVEGLSHDLVGTGSIYHVHFAWQVWHGQLSPRFKFKILKSFSGVEIDQNHVDKRILGGKGFAVGRLKRHNFCPASVWGEHVMSQCHSATGYQLPKIASQECQLNGWTATIPIIRFDYSLMVSCWNCLMTRWLHPVPDGQGQILLSNMDTWAPERQLSKSCVRLASKNSPDLNKAAKAFLSFWILWIFVNSRFKPWKPLSGSLCLLIFLQY